MGRAFACDRCSRLFKKDDFVEKIPVVLENGSPFGIDFGNANIYIALCPECRAGFQKWWDEEAAHKTTDSDCPSIVHTLYEENEEHEDEDK